MSFVIHSRDIHSRNIEIPIMSKANTQAAIKWEMERISGLKVTLPYIADDKIIDAAF